MIPYILNVTVITTICFLFYKLFLQKETFYRLNRWMLMGSLAIAFVLPLLPVPQQLSWRGPEVQQEVVDAQPKIAVKQDIKVALPTPASGYQLLSMAAQAAQAALVAGSGLTVRARVRHHRSRAADGAGCSPHRGEATPARVRR